MELSEAAALHEKHAAAISWAADAQAVLDRERPFADEDATMLEVSSSIALYHPTDSWQFFSWYLQEAV